MLPSKVLNLISSRIIGCGIEVHRRLGPGLLESVYDEAMSLEFHYQKVSFKRQVAVPIRYRDQELAVPLKLDFLIADTVILELKAVEMLLPVHQAQLLSYLKLTGKQLGLLMNFNVATLKEGIRRMRC
ncbi:MAG: GxxExxY protein [Planctomycetes bacterium]|nr:GxxExxY protein [Planctomycetota bacterium]